jgi:hypothetical protein
METIEITRNDVFSFMNKGKVRLEWALLGGVSAWIFSMAMFYIVLQVEIIKLPVYYVSVFCFLLGVIFIGWYGAFISKKSIFLWKFSTVPNKTDIEIYKVNKFVEFVQEFEQNTKTIEMLQKRNIAIQQLLMDLE